jgi:hypothetical protein
MVVRPTTVQMTVVSECGNKVRHNLLQKPALMDGLHISCTRTVPCSKVTKRVWRPYSINALIGMLNECWYTHAKLQCNKCGTNSERQTSPLVGENTSFPSLYPILINTTNVPYKDAIIRPRNSKWPLSDKFLSPTLPRLLNEQIKRKKL